MRRVFSSSVFALLLAASISLSAQSRPAVEGTVAGIELCPQSICGFALFVGGFRGELNSGAATGTFAGAITHDPLPAIFASAELTGGQWTITANRRVLKGAVSGGQIYNIDGTRYCVEMTMEVTDGGRGQLYFTGLLDHNPFPPTIGGIVRQEPVPCAVFLRASS